MKFDKIYSTPFSRTFNYVYTKKHTHAFSIIDISEEKMSDIVDCLNSNINPWIEQGILTYSEDVQQVLHNETPIIDVRGWGHLTGTGGLNLDEDLAESIQDEFGAWLVEKLTLKV